MPKKLPPHVTRETTRHGQTVFYFRRYPGPRIRLRAAYDTPEWAAEYHAALTGQEPLATVNKAANGSLRWLWDRYRETAAWANYTPPTRKQRENIMRHVLEDNGGKAGDMPFLAVSRAHIVAGRDRRKDTPNQARHFLDTMRGVFAWALDSGHVKVAPAAGVKAPPRKKGGGFKAWTEDEVQQFERTFPLGTRQRVWLDVYLYTGLRRGDAAFIGRQHVQRTPQSIWWALVIADHRSFRAAARELGVRHASVSRRLRDLEDSLGATLFERSRRGLKITHAGANFIQQARDAFQQLQHASRTAGPAT